MSRSVGSVRAVGPLLASGRDSDIYEYGPGLVLRRARDGRSLEREARTMEYVRSRGYPVPFVDEVVEGGTAVVMERIDGPSMVKMIERRPWQMGRQARVLAALHIQLHQIEAPDWLGPAPGTMEGTALLHLDLHPLNVIVAGRGAVVIDWPNAARGTPAADVALTWILLESGQIPGPGPVTAILARFRSVLVRSFVAEFDLAAVREQVPAMVDYKVQDENMSAAECRAMRRLAERVAAG